MRRYLEQGINHALSAVRIHEDALGTQLLVEARCDLRLKMDLAISFHSWLALHWSVGTDVKEAWQAQDAQAHFSELVEPVLNEGPQTVTRRGTTVVVVLAYGEYLRLSQSDTSLDDALFGAPQDKN